MGEIKIPIMEDVTSSSYGNPPENKEDYKAYDIYRKLDGKEKKAMQKNIEKYSVKFSAGLDERVLPAMPKTRNATLQGKRNFLKIIAERQARLQAQIDWLHREQEKHRQEEQA